jgi:hypothetical protein
VVRLKPSSNSALTNSGETGPAKSDALKSFNVAGLAGQTATLPYTGT